MKKTVFALLLTLTAAHTFAENRQIEWDHANDSGTIPNLIAVHSDSVHHRKDDDSVKFAVASENTQHTARTGSNDTHERLAKNAY